MIFQWSLPQSIPTSNSNNSLSLTHGNSLSHQERGGRFSKTNPKVACCHPFRCFVFQPSFWKGSWRICFRNIAWPKCGGALFLRFVFFWPFFHVYLAALILSIQWCFGMTPNTVVFPCVSVHVKIMSLLLLLVADGSCKSRSLYTTIITLKSFRRALTAPPAINLLSSRSICRNDFASKFAYDSRTSTCFSSPVISPSLWFQTNVYPRLTANIFMERWLTTCHVSSNGSLPRKKQNVTLRNPISFLQKQLPFFETCRRGLGPKRSKRSTSEILPCQHNWNRMH